MYRAYEISEDTIFKLLREYHPNAVFQDSNKKEEIEEYFKSFYDGQTHIYDAKDIWDRYFPKVTCNVFLSHSSGNNDLVQKFSRLLKEKMSLSCFIDSDLWGNITDLQRNIDDEHCLNSGGQTYSYAKRNYSTAHVHAILNYALTRMIDDTECFIFIKTDDSCQSITNELKGTASPWIFHELTVAKNIKQNIPKRWQKVIELRKSQLIESREKFTEESYKILYPSPDFAKISYYDLSTIFLESKEEKPEENLDKLYKQVASL